MLLTWTENEKLSGLLLLALGSYAMDKGISGFVSSDHIAVGIIIIGIIFAIVAFVGFMGAIRESRRTMIAVRAALPAA